jgi:metal-responsive CopG/Arc/MetJ family transcriptional regulator
MKLDKATESVSISIPSWLLQILDEVCEQKDFCRSTFAKRAIKKYLLSHMDNPTLWKSIYNEIIEKS